MKKSNVKTKNVKVKNVKVIATSTKKRKLVNSVKPIKSVKSAMKVKKNLKRSLSKTVISKIDVLDQLLLKLSDERKLALQLGSRILDKAREVRDSLMKTSQKNRG